MVGGCRPRRQDGENDLGFFGPGLYASCGVQGSRRAPVDSMTKWALLRRSLAGVEAVKRLFISSSPPYMPTHPLDAIFSNFVLLHGRARDGELMPLAAAATAADADALQTSLFGND